jgi:hypothetical protein
MSLGIFRVLGIILFLYLVWRNLNENYDDQKLITFSWLGLLGFLVFGRLFYGLINWGVWNNDLIDWVSVGNKPGMSYIGGYLGFILVAWWFVRKEQWKFLGFVEDLMKPLIIMLWLFMLDEFLRSKFSINVVVFFVLLVMIFLFAGWVTNKYRSFVWYKSGKKGFVLLSSNFLFFLILIPVLILFKDNLVNIILSLSVSLVSLIGLLILGGKNYDRK